MLQKTVRSRVVIAFLLLLLLSGLLAGSAAAAPDTISRVTISDVRDVAFTVSWVTSSASNGTVYWGTTTSPAPSTAVADGISSTTTHYVEISGLSSNTTYYFYVTSGSDTDNNGWAYYQVTTGPSITPNSPGNTIWGYVYRSNGSTLVPNAIVYLQLQDANGSGSPGPSQLVSARADSSGVWNYSLSNIRTSDLTGYYIFTSADNQRLIGQGGDQGTRGLDPSPFIIQVPVTDPYQQDIVLNQSPTAVTLASFTGESHPGSILLDWLTANEVGLLGFNLHRSDSLGGVKQKLNASLIPAETPGSLTGNSYQFQDGTVVSGKTYYYWIELVMLSENQDYGPVSLLAPYWIWLPILHH